MHEKQEPPWRVGKIQTALEGSDQQRKKVLEGTLVFAYVQSP